jgi:hypothetical protein
MDVYDPFVVMGLILGQDDIRAIFKRLGAREGKKGILAHRDDMSFRGLTEEFHIERLIEE